MNKAVETGNHVSSEGPKAAEMLDFDIFLTPAVYPGSRLGMYPTTVRPDMKRALLSMLALTLVVVACSDQMTPAQPDTEPQMAMVPVSVAAAPAISTLTITVSASDITSDLVFNVTMTNGEATDTITIPAGSDRTITVRGFDTSGIETHRGSKTVNLTEGVNAQLTVVLSSLTGYQPLVVALGETSVAVTPDSASVLVGGTTQLAAVVTDEAGDTLGVNVRWASSHPAVATVDNAGLVSGISVGAASIVGTFGGAIGGATVSVAAPPPTLTIDGPARDTVVMPGESISLSGTAISLEDGDLSASIVWFSSQDGRLGEGRSIGVDLSEGAHVIVAEVSDSRNQTSRDSVSVSVRLPAVVSWAGSTSQSWSESNNWDLWPLGSGDRLVFPAGVTNKAMVNDLASGAEFESLTFYNDGGYSLTGNEIGLSNGLTTECCGRPTLDLPIRLLGSQTLQAAGLNSPIDLNGFDLTIEGYGTSANGVISGVGSVTLARNTLSVTADNTYVGPTLVATYGGIFGTQPQSDVTVTGQMFGAGAVVGSLTVSEGGLLAPGTGTPCCGSTNGVGLIETKDLTFNSNSSFSRVAIEGLEPGISYDQVRVQGAVVIGPNVNLNVTMSEQFTPATGQAFVLIDNDGTDPVTGTFQNRPEGSVLTLNQAFEFQITYTGGDGNDIALVATSVPQSWTGAVSALWSEGGNWSSGSVPQQGDRLVFPAGVTNKAMVNDLASGAEFESLTFYNDGGYSLTGNEIGLSNGLTTECCGRPTLDLPIRLLGSQTLQAAGLNSPIDLNGFDLTIEGYGTSANGVISGVGSVTLARNTLSVTADNTYVGPTLVATYGGIFGTQPQSDVTVTGQMFGAGAVVGSLTVSEGGLLAPGTGTPCCGSTNGVGLIETKDLTFNSNSSFSRVAIEGLEPGISYDQVRVQGAVVIGPNVNLNVTMSEQFTPATGQAFVLIDNDGTDPVTGTFQNRPEGSVLTLNQAFEFQITYTGGDGNDIALIRVR
jgi:hypothetical protein